MQVEIPEKLPIFPLRDAVIYPYLPAQLSSVQEQNIRLINDALAGDRTVGMLTVRNPHADEVGQDDLYGVGTAAVIHKMWKLPDGSVRVLVEGLARIALVEMAQTKPYLVASVQPLSDRLDGGVEVDALASNAANQFQKMAALVSYLPEELRVLAVNIDDPARLADFIAFHLNLRLTEKQALLEDLDIRRRLERLTVLLGRELQILELGKKIQDQVQIEMGKAQREHYLREQIRAMQKELGEGDERESEIAELRARIESAQMPEEALREALRELERMGRMYPAAADYAVSRTYLDWLVSVPWRVATEDRIDIGLARQTLDEDHFGLGKIKDRILEVLSVRKLKPDARGPILCFLGPPGVGKTSLGQSIARALGRKFVRISLGGVRDEADIRGHRRTYVGALPGRIVQGIRRAGSRNPVFMLDEIDKLGQDFRGDPSAALLEVLDPQQNCAFVDHYLDVPFDLSRVMFITTANLLGPVPDALCDRMEVVELRGYTEEEKVEIVRRHLLPRQLREHGLSGRRLRLSRPSIAQVIRGYTQEAGLRNLEREIGTVCRKVAREIARGKTETLRVSEKDLHAYLGPIRFRSEVAETSDEIGVVTGLAVTGAGGEVLFVEVVTVPGRGGLILTGQLGDVMRESAQAALTYIRSRARPLGLTPSALQKLDLHIHIPAGAVPKDGPSAGVTMTTALASALTKRPARRDVAMTGEVTLRGKVLPIGGVRDKVLAAHRAGIRTVILPAENEKDIEDIPEHVRNDLRFVFADHMDRVLNEALRPETAQEKVELVVAA